MGNPAAGAGGSSDGQNALATSGPGNRVSTATTLGKSASDKERKTGGRSNGQTSPLTAPSSKELHHGYPLATSRNNVARPSGSEPAINQTDRNLSLGYDQASGGKQSTRDGNAMSAPDRNSTIRRIDQPYSTAPGYKKTTAKTVSMPSTSNGGE